MGLTFNLGRVSPSVFTDSSLNVGIGGAPSGTYKLEVTGTAKVSSTLLVSGLITGSSGATISGVGGANPLLLTNTDYNTGTSTGSSMRLRLGAASGNTYSDIQAIMSGGASLAILALNPSGGNVGIGTTTPTNLLTIKNNNGGTQGIDFQSYSTSSVQAQIIHDQLDDTFNIISSSAFAAGGIVFKTNGTIKMKIITGGNVLIGTTTANGYKLQVNGEGYATGWNVANTGGSVQTIDAGAYVSLLGATGSPANTILLGTNNTQRIKISDATFALRGQNSSNTGVQWENAAGTRHWSIFEQFGASGQQGSLNFENNVAGTTPLVISSGDVPTFTGRVVANGFRSSGQIFGFFKNSTGSFEWEVGSDGSVGTGMYMYNPTNGYAFKLTAAGVLTTLGGGTSDIRTKEDIIPITENAISFINELKPVSFKFINDKSKKIRRGFIAQEVLETSIPTLVLGDGELEDGTYGLDYDGILALAVKAIQEQNQTITSLQEQINELKNK